MTESIALESVEDRRAFLHKTFAPELSSSNEWLKDLNEDGIHDWRDLAVEKDEIWMLEDEDGDGLADSSTQILHDFNEEITDVAGALLVRDNDVFLGIGPDMWRLQDKNGDGILENKKSISHGYGVHIGFSGHGMSGAIEGPDGKIYWGIGDIGMNIQSLDGSNHKYPNQGVIVRSNPDGSNFEVFAHGLRNTHEFVFDEYGNLISADNDGDHGGESERLVHIVEGSDAGWRTNWQFGKYTDPKNNGYKVWMDEILFKPRWEGQAAYIIPPIQNFHNGPTGMVYNPGTALGSKWKNNFFLVEFAGNPTRSNIWAFKLKPSGASFVLDQEEKVINGILPTGIRFGPDGALYMADWINGWDTKNYGRVWKMDVDATENDLKNEREKTKRLIQLEYNQIPFDELENLLEYEDMRVRSKSQFELVYRGKKGAETFEKIALESSNQLARIHSIWGLGQLAGQGSDVGQVLIALLGDKDPEIVAQTAKILGDVRYSKAGTSLIPLLSSSNKRVQFFTAQALGRIQFKNAVPDLLKMLEKNNDVDVYLRHAAVLALSRIEDKAAITALVDHPEKSLRLAAVLILRKWSDPAVAEFLKDEDEYIVTEAARAINDDWSIEEALEQLAAVLKEDRFTSEPLLRRSINACLRVGGKEEMEMLLSFAKRKSASIELRAEALATLGTWAEPSVMDRVDGRYRGPVKRESTELISLIKSHIDDFLKENEPEFLISVAQMLGHLSIQDYNEQLNRIMTLSKDSEVRSAMLTTLNNLNYSGMETAVRRGMEDQSEAVRTTALGLLENLEISKENLPGIVNPIFENGTSREQQKVLGVLGSLPAEKSEEVLNNLIDQLLQGKIPPAITLDLSEAVEASKSQTLMARMASLPEKENTRDAYAETLYGGDARSGYDYFRNNSTGQCVRCHAINGQGGTVGPSLSNIGNILTREELLEALIEPSKRLSPGFGSVSLTLNNGQTVTGILMEEHEDELILKTSEAEPMEINTSRITKRTNIPSSMPPMGSLMSKREIRDMIEFLGNRKSAD
jgi:putative membrane-bound dehydrogenase-like protein